MTHFYTRRNIIIGFAVCLLLISFFAYYSYRDLRKVEEESREVTLLIHSLTTVDDILDDMLNIETAQRGYVISGDEAYLEPFYGGISKLKKDSIELKQLAVRYPGQAPIYSDLLHLIKQKLAFVQNVVQLRRDSGYTPALHLVQTDRGRIYMDSIRAAVTSVEIANRELLTVMNTSREKHAQSTANLFTMLAVVSLLILFILFYLMFRGVSQRDKYEKQIAYLASLTDQALVISEERYKTLVEQAGDAITIFDAKGQVQDVNNSATQLLGYTKEEFQKLNLSDILTRDELAQHPLRYDVLDQGTATIRQRNMQRKDGTIVRTEVNTKKLSNGLFISLVRDLTEREKAEHHIRELQRQFSSFMETLPARAWIVDEKGNFHYMNSLYQEITGGKDLTGKNFMDVLPADMVKLQQESNGIVFKTNDVLTQVEHSVNGQGRKAIYQVFKFPLGISKGVKMLGGIALDITEQYKYQESMKKLNEQLAVSNRELEQFAYVASHDLQEPLRMISSFLGLLKKKYTDQLDETAQQYIHFAVDGAERMKILISDLLNFSRVGSSKQVFTNVDTGKILEAVLASLRTLIRESGVSILVSPLPVVHADATQLGQLFQNLVVNAIKYRGPVDPSISIGCVETEKEWEFSIRDNGIGFDRSQAEKIFIIFQRLHTRNEYSGTGIGLAICKKIVERHGGRIWADSIPGQGSTFYFTLLKNS